VEARTIVWTAAGVALAAVVLQSVGEVANFALDADIDALDADEELNVFAWASSMSTFAAAFFLFVPAVVVPTLDRVRLLVAGALAFFSLDDALSFHERLAERSVQLLDSEVSLERVVWPVVYLPLLAFVFVILFRMARRHPNLIGTALLVGLGLLALAVVGEVTSALYVEDEETWGSTIEVAVEEGAELAGWILIAGALAARLYADARARA
jgi:hypothetical protein